MLNNCLVHLVILRVIQVVIVSYVPVLVLILDVVPVCQIHLVAADSNVAVFSAVVEVIVAR